VEQKQIIEEYFESRTRVLLPSNGGTPVQSIPLPRLTKTKSGTAKMGDPGGEVTKQREGDNTGNKQPLSIMGNV
jgi:hypothetical protein